LTEVDSIRSEERTAKAQQRLETGISAQVAVVKLGPEYWTSLRSWAEERRLLSPDRERLVALAAGLLPGLPNDRQSRKLLEVKAQMEAEGFIPAAIPI
jgi:hypothetical protein